MADYQLATPDPEGPVIRTADNAYVPNDPGNADYQKYLVWLANGGVPDPYIPPPQPEPAPPPAEVADVVLFDHENRLRVLEGQPPLTIAQFKAMQ